MVAFEDRFWGDKHNGFDVLYHNMKYGNSVSVKVTEFIRERSAVEESYCKALSKLAKSACSVSQLGSFEPLWGVLRAATDKLASAHHTLVQKLHELGKELKEYGDKQKERHKAAKEEFSGTADIVQTMQSMTTGLIKAKEIYYARCHEMEKLKKDGTSQKEIEKAESKTKKAGEDYKALVERREVIRNEFHDKMVETSRKFQQIEEEHLKTIIGHLETYIDSHLSGCKIMEEVHTEFRERLRVLTIDKLLDQLVRSKGTGTDIPGVITFEEYEEHHNSVVNLENSQGTNKSQPIKTQSSGFPLMKKKEKKQKKKAKNKKEKGNNSSPSNSQESPEHQHNGPVESPVSEGSEAMSQDQSFEVDEEGYRIRPPDTGSAKSAGGSSDSDSDSDDDDEPRRIQVTIKPVDDRMSQTASVDEIKKITESLSLSSPLSMRRNLSSSSGLNDGFRSRASTENSRNASTSKLSRSSDDLLDISFGNNPKTMTSPGSDSNLSSNLNTPTDTTKTTIKQDTNFKGIAAVGTFDSFSSKDTFTTSSPAGPFNVGDSNEANGNGTEDSPPALPKKKGSHTNVLNVTSDDPNIPPPLPAKKEGAGLHSYQSGGGASSALNNSSDLSKPSASTLPFFMKPPGQGVGEIPRVGSTGSALARPRPQGGQKKPGLTLTTQPPPSQEVSYSQELFALLSDFTSSSKANDSEDGGPKTPKTPSKVSYVGSVALTTSETTNTQVMTRAVTTTSIDGLSESIDRQENASGMIRSKTVGSMPAVPSRVLSVSHTSAKEEVLPIAVAFIESVNAFFRGSDHKACMVKVTGDITVSFPASVIPQLTSDKELPSLSFFVTGTSSLEQIVPNKTLISSDGQQSGGDAVSFKFNMNALASHLKKQVETATSSYYNIDILKYEVRASGIQSTPLQLCSYWKCEPESTNIRIDYRYNSSCMSTPCALTNVNIIAPVNGGVTIMQSKPSANWSAENQRAVWVLPEISSSKDQDCTLRAKLDLTEGPSTPSRIAVQFSSTGSTISKLNFELKSDAYKLSLVKKQITTGKYISES